MEILIVAIFIIGKLIYDANQQRKADEYARKVVRRYDDNGIPKI